MKTIHFGISIILICLCCIHAPAQDLRVAGNIGVGTIPDTKLDVNGTVRIRDLPVGDGTPVVADEAGNLFTSDGINSNDSLTYTVVEPYGPAIALGTYPLHGFNIGGASGELVMTFNLTKAVDRNTAGFLSLFAFASPSNIVTIKIDVYEAGSDTPYATHKVRGLTILAYSQAYPAGAGQSETFTIAADKYGFKDQVSGTSFAHDTRANLPIDYEVDFGF